ncbi:FAD/NAD(P)-binding domain-containing protein [Massarina eburnea CBS 473.64]|uniref:FAD/NAD(P)-binding domain-containing protein n=1 Tax=Massarina eburnea CBS 473.64 TaxID=1395130 RepID=A0A6A6SBK3_9PLEO|nr:FAD/NAD(P)-binding domain-containing protein [Massarina eburnea CBS 473.64]
MAKEAVIIGGSIGGLMCGVMLKHHGYTVTILEKEDLVSRPGYDAGLSIRSEVLDFLEKHDRVKRDMFIACEPGTLISLDGKPKAQRGQTMTLTSWALLVGVLRANFDGRTSKAIPIVPEDRDSDGTATYISGARVINVRDLGEKVQIDYEDAVDETKEMMSISADFVVVADGSNSSIRSILVPEVERKYAGYMLWRGTTREGIIGQEWNDLYSEKSTFSFGKGQYILNYTIPTDDGNLSPGKRLHNWLWYSTMAADSPDLKELFTDINGKEHLSVLPRGLVKPEVWEKQKALADSILPEGLAEIVKQSTSPFITKVFDVVSPKALFFSGKVFLVGDAQATIRPNIGLGSTHAAHDCNNLERFIEGKITAEEWEKAVLRYSAVQASWLLLMLAQKTGLAYFAAVIEARAPATAPISSGVIKSWQDSMPYA